LKAVPEGALAGFQRKAPEFEAKARELNEQGHGDQACFFLQNRNERDALNAASISSSLERVECLRLVRPAIAENTHGTQVSGRRPSAGMIQKREI